MVGTSYIIPWDRSKNLNYYRHGLIPYQQDNATRARTLYFLQRLVEAAGTASLLNQGRQHATVVPKHFAARTQSSQISLKAAAGLTGTFFFFFVTQPDIDGDILFQS